jgi:ATP-dependent Lon protease
MVVTIAVETDEAKAAFEAVGEQDQVLLVPRVDGRYGRIGVIAQIEDRGTLPGTVRSGVPPSSAQPWAPAWSAPAALWVEAEPSTTRPILPTGSPSWREYRAAARSLLEKVGGRV